MVATMVAKSHWFYSMAITQEGDFHKIVSIGQGLINSLTSISRKRRAEELFSLQEIFDWVLHPKYLA